MRSDFTDTENVVVACKAGKNDDPHHGHLDVGQFMVYWRGEAYIADLGTAEYDEKYFGPEKYDTPHAASRGHNLIFVNGEGQVPGKLRGQPMDESIGGEVLEFRPGDKRDYTLLDPSNAYRREHLKGWRRHIVYDKPVTTVIVDEVMCDRGDEIEARFHSDAKQSAGDGFVMLKGNEGSMAIIPVVDSRYTFREDRHAYLAYFKNSSFKWIPYVGTVVTAADDKTVIAHIVVPVENEAEAEKIARSAKRSGSGDSGLTVSFTKNGAPFSYRFVRGEGGLVLER